MIQVPPQSQNTNLIKNLKLDLTVMVDDETLEPELSETIHEDDEFDYSPLNIRSPVASST